jgi:hypothetical protein
MRDDQGVPDPGDGSGRGPIVPEPGPAPVDPPPPSAPPPEEGENPVDPGLPFKPTRVPPHGPKRRAVGEPKKKDDPPTGDGDGDDSTPTPASTRRTVKEPREILLNQSAAGLERDIAFGQCLQGTKWLYANTFQNGTVFYGVAAISEGPIRKIVPRADGTRLSVFSGSETNPSGTQYRSSNGRIKVWVYDGSQTNTQETASGLFALDPTWITDGTDSPYDYLAFAVVRVAFQIDTQVNVPSFDFELEGYRDLYDPTDTTRKYSTNRALWIREILTNTRWGRKLAEAKINDTVWATATTDCREAIFPATPSTGPTLADGGAGTLTGTFTYKYTNVRNNVQTLPSSASSPIVVSSKKVDVTVPAGDSFTTHQRIYRSSDGVTYKLCGTLTGSGGGVFTDNTASIGANAIAPTRAPIAEKRYEGGGILISRKASGLDWINTLRVECLGVLQWNDGKLGLFINKAFSGTPKVYRDTHDGATKPNVNADSITWGRKPRHDLPNCVEVRYTDIQNGYQTASVVKQRAAVTAGTELERRSVFDLRGIGDSSYAGRIATSLLNLFWDDMEGEFVASRDAIESLPWDVATLYGGGLSGQQIRIRKIRGKGEDFRITFTEYQDASYSDAIVEEDAPIATEETTAVADDVIPEVTDFNPDPTDFGKIYWSPAQEPSLDQFGSSFFTSSNLGSYDGERVNNGLISSKAFDLNVALQKYLTFDAGSGNTKAFRRVDLWIDGTDPYSNDEPSFTVQYSDDGSSWSSMTTAEANDGNSVQWITEQTESGLTRAIYKWGDVGDHRYWRIDFGASAVACDVYEVWFREHVEDFQRFKANRVYDMQGGSPVLFAEVTTNPTAGAPLNVDALRLIHSNPAAGQDGLKLRITTVALDGSESAGLNYRKFASASALAGRSRYVNQAEAALTLANGANADVAIGVGPLHQYITGPTAAFSTSGFDATAYAGGEYLTIYNATAYPWTIPHDDAGSAAANRILTRTGGSVTIQPGKFARFLRLGSASRWFLETDPIFRARSSADFDKTNTTLSDVPGLTLTLGPGNYELRAWGNAVLTSGSPGFAYRLGGTVTATLEGGWLGTEEGNPSPASWYERETAIGSGGIGVPTTSLAHRMTFTGTLVVTVAGTLTLQFARTAASGTARLRAGAYMVAVPLP